MNVMINSKVFRQRHCEGTS